MNLRWFIFSFKGRINRQPYWLFTLCAGLIWLILSLLLGIDLLHESRDPKSLIPMLLLLWPSLAVQAKRWHDRDKSAWWILIGLLPIIGPIWTLVETGFLSGTNGPNRFGEDPLGRSPEKPMPAQTPVEGENLTDIKFKPGKYYLSSFMKTMMILVGVLVVLSSFMFVAIGKMTSIESPGGLIPFIIMDTLIICVIIWRIVTPVIEISNAGIKVGIPFIFKTNAARWEEIEAMVVGELNTLGFKERNIKLLLRSGNTSSKEMLVSLKAVEKPEEIIGILRAKIPQKGYEDIKQAPVLQKPVTKAEVRFRQWRLNDAGLMRGKEAISWGHIREIKYAGLVIAGYGATTISYVGEGGLKKTATVQPAAKEEYLDFIRYLMQHAHKASIDPGLLKALEYPPKDARADLSSIVLLLTGIILVIISSTFIFWYSNEIAAGYLNAAMLIPLGVLPLLWSVKVISGRFRGKAESTAQKVLWPLLSNLGPIASVPVFFILSPFSFYWFAGDISVKMGDLVKAEGYYKSALEKSPDGIDVLYELGQLYMAKKDYPEALEYLKKAYTKDPTYWGPRAVVLIPDVLMEMGNYDEALDWCRRIVKDRPGKNDISRAIDKKRDEIMKKKELSKQDQNQL